MEPKSPLEVQRSSTTFDNISFGLGEIDYVKMDIEGAEEAVLLHGAAWLPRVQQIKVEVHAPVTIERIAELLQAHGFICRRDEHHWSTVVAERA